MQKRTLKRCVWIGDDVMCEYHDAEWGVPVRDDPKHFEFLVLDAFQVGLSWRIVLNKRKSFRKASLILIPALSHVMISKRSNSS